MDIESATVTIDGKQWEGNLPELGDLEVQIAPWDNPVFERELQRQIRALPANLRADGQVEPKAFYRCTGKAIIKGVLFDWRNLKVGGVDKPFDKAFAEQLVTDPKYRPFRDGIVAAARRVQQGLKVEDEALEGNSPASSLGSESGEANQTG